MRAGLRCAFVAFFFAALPAGGVLAQSGGQALYLANEGVLVSKGDTRVLFDPLFEDSYGRYLLPSAEMVDALMDGRPPFDGIDAVFVSHAHGDHFSARLILRFLRAQPTARLYAPAQAVRELRGAAGISDRPIFDRVTAIAMELDDEPMTFDIGDVSIGAVRVPHSGWPTRMTDIENIVFSVSLEDAVTVAHFGDADPNPAHFNPQRAWWRERATDLAMPPFWFFNSDGGREILATHFESATAIGVHVPTDVSNDPADWPEEIREHDLFTKPGETRDIP